MRDDLKDLKKLAWALVIGLVVNAVVSSFVAYEAREANRHATKAERTLAERDFERIYREHAELHRVVTERCGR